MSNQTNQQSKKDNNLAKDTSKLNRQVSKKQRLGSSIHHPLYVRTPSLAILGVWAVGITLFLYFWDTITLLLLVFLAASVVVATLNPVVKAIPYRRKVVGSIVGVLFVLLLFILPALVGWLMSSPIDHMFHQIPHIQDAMNKTLASISTKLHLSKTITVESLIHSVMSWMKNGKFGSFLAQAAGVAISATIAIALMCFGIIYMLSQPKGQIVEPLEKILPIHRQGALHKSITQIEHRLRWWLLGTVVAMVVISLLCWAGFALMGLKYSLPLAILAGVCEIIPTIGPILAFTVAILVAAGQNLQVFIGVAIIYIIIQSFESHILQPVIMSKAVRIPPVVVLFTLVFWAEIIGPLGLLMAIPLDLTIWAFVDNFIIHEGIIDYDYKKQY